MIASVVSVPDVLLKSSLVVLLAISCSGTGAVAAKTSPPQKTAQRHALTNSELVEILRTAKVTDASYNLSATQTGDELIVSTQQNPKFNQDDTKVQGVLIAKTAFDVLPDSIQRTKILFHDPESGSFSEVLINRTVIETYGKGQMDEKKLLGSLELEKKGGEQTAEVPDKELTVVDGPMQEQRMLTLTRIEYMKKRGAELSKPESEFAEAEKLAAANDHAGVKAKLSEIKTILDEQGTALKSAQKAASGQSISRIESGQVKAETPDHLGYLIHFLRNKGVSVDAEQREYDATKKSNNPGLSGKEQNRLRAQLAMNLRAKLANLPKNQQIEFKNSEASWEASNASNDNGNTSKGESGHQFGKFRKRMESRMQGISSSTGKH